MEVNSGPRAWQWTKGLGSRCKQVDSGLITHCKSLTGKPYRDNIGLLASPFCVAPFIVFCYCPQYIGFS